MHQQRKNKIVAELTPELIARSQNAVRLMVQEAPEESFAERECEQIENELYSLCWQYGDKHYSHEEIQQMTRRELCEALYPLVLAYHQERAAVTLYVGASVRAKRGWFKDQVGIIVEIDFDDSYPYIVEFESAPGNNVHFCEEGLERVEGGKEEAEKSEE